jgi:hypothetical protein
MMKQEGGKRYHTFLPIKTLKYGTVPVPRVPSKCCCLIINKFAQCFFQKALGARGIGTLYRQVSNSKVREQNRLQEIAA